MVEVKITLKSKTTLKMVILPFDLAKPPACYRSDSRALRARETPVAGRGVRRSHPCFRGHFRGYLNLMK